jgi:hypothetical protein
MPNDSNLLCTSAIDFNLRFEQQTGIHYNIFFICFHRNLPKAVTPVIFVKRYIMTRYFIVVDVPEASKAFIGDAVNEFLSFTRLQYKCAGGKMTNTEKRRVY